MTAATSTTSTTPVTHAASTDAARAAVAPRELRDHDPIPTGRLLAVELRKMFDTRSGLWLLAGIGILAALATGAVILWAPDSELTFDTFAAAIGIPMSVILPIIAILSVTSEWSQRTGLTTFTFVPSRSRVVAAKLACTIGVGVVSIAVACVIGALGNVVGSAIAGVDTTWDISVAQLGTILLAQVLGMLIGFMLAVLLRSSAGAIVAYFVYSFVLTGLTATLAATQQWFADLQPWVDFNYTQGNLFGNVPTAEGWAQLAVTGFFWLAVPLVVGLRLVMRSEVK